MIRAVLFDLDGTLADTLDEIARTMNLALDTCGFVPRPLDDYRRFVGEGLRILAERVLPEEARTEANTTQLVETFHEATPRTWLTSVRLYDGIAPLLEGLAWRRIRLAVLTNKNHETANQLLEQLVPAGTFDAIQGMAPGVLRKPDPAGARAVLGRLAVRPEEAAMLGDTAIDMATARATGMAGLGAAWGFRPVAELETAGATAIFAHPAEVLAWVDAQNGRGTARA